VSTPADVDELAQMRWDLRLEEAPGTTRHDQATSLNACAAFLRRELIEQRWPTGLQSRIRDRLTHLHSARPQGAQAQPA
jgi:hypothetical protein